MAETIPFTPPAHGPDAAARALCCEALALARRAQAAGLTDVAAALDFAALEAARAFGLFEPYGLPRPPQAPPGSRGEAGQARP